jgi:outer membrane protein assembly factor BamE (lipoprotein component of BamABCDE complex)
MKIIIVLALFSLFLLGCEHREPEHPYVQGGMTKTQVTDIVGTPIRTDYLRHVLTFDLGRMTADRLDSLRQTMEKNEGNQMIMGHPLLATSVDSAHLNWYYGAAIVDTMFTYDAAPNPGSTVKKFWYVITKQRAVTFDAQSGLVSARGFVVLKVDTL